MPCALLAATLACAATSGCSDGTDPLRPCAGAGVICRLAGTGARSFDGDGHAATRTDFYLLSAVRPGPDGRLYLMDFNNHRLRVVEEDGTVATIAGNGEHVFAEEGIPATASPLENPVDFGFLADGTVVLVPLHDPRVLAVGADGILRVLAGTGEVADGGDGGPARDARFMELTGLVVAPDGSIFVSDGLASRVRVIRPSGIVETVAGRGLPGYDGDGGAAADASLWRPEGLALDGDGNLYIADAGAHVVRRVLASGTIETFAGTGDRGFSGDGGPATAARLSLPGGVAVAPDGTVYLADTRNDCIRRVDAGGTIHALAGDGHEGISGDGGDALEARLYGPAHLSFADGALYVADQLNSVARVVYVE